MTILVTGGAGYIGSHTVLELLTSGYDVVVLDNLCNASAESLKRVELLTGKTVTFYKADIRDRAAVDGIFERHRIEAVIHFAGLKAVGESTAKPLDYYSVNVSGSVVLAQAMAAAGVTKLIFSSSATVYGEDAPVPYREDMPRGKTSNPYGTSKAMVEQILTDISFADERWSAVLLRYFNPFGAHLSGQIGEDPQGVPNNLMPFIAQVAVGRRESLSIFGDDYDTKDGTCERDYLHVVDLAKGHVLALKATEQSGTHIYNLGTGKATSVKQVVQAFERVTGVTIPYSIAPRRAGDLPAFWAEASKAFSELGWRAEMGIDDMMRDTWRWQQNNPNGYRG
ncbi:UDP-glucose 4-epimerase GalE [Idiomarina piscisalsi]|uniref:UDP-glucose 4-epimerase n=1 Tax=Idiomarina piscisalsi TaxID=1096243 RepID=A0A432YQW6_9GAMM|nr:UDP-glucose 4-epimerase GalE [Idiomarina piscisalsi]RUO64101.1 UDP-glucose 4-epimerase GalE [Idiomarina piscisalsi]